VRDIARERNIGPLRIVAAAGALLLLLAGPDAADHDHGGHAPAATDGFIATVGLVAATYDAMLFDGDYQGLTGSLAYARGRFVVGAAGSAYRLQKNGKIVRGSGDAIVHAQADLVTRGRTTAGVVLAVMLPLGNDDDGLGMGHVMAMPGIYMRASRGRIAVASTVAYGRGLGNEAVHAEHGGVWPLVEPMNYHELTFAWTATLALASQLRAGLRVAGGAPLGDGDGRVSAGVRSVWTAGRVETAFEIAAGFAGAPFIFRGTLATAISF
jgi:hypothetical protein